MACIWITYLVIPCLSPCSTFLSTNLGVQGCELRAKACSVFCGPLGIHGDMFLLLVSLRASGVLLVMKVWDCFPPPLHVVP